MTRILVVEDEEDIRQILAYNLGQAGYEVIIADRGDKALATARDKHPDLILLDLMLPDVSGLDICRTLKSDALLREIPVIMLTARSDEIDRVVGFELGADASLACAFKPCSAAHAAEARWARFQTLKPSWSLAVCASIGRRIGPGSTMTK